ncbi:MAG: hypothetical protein JW776_04440 [Candidatus Lokiarchaeota archaeon]|nr:hypothetical protein [Candidatus Lokiarchaeota archaeon]
MSGLRDWLASVLGNTMGILTWASLIIGTLLVVVGIANAFGKHKRMDVFLFSTMLGSALIFLFLYLYQPKGLFSGTPFSK